MSRSSSKPALIAVIGIVAAAIGLISFAPDAKSAAVELSTAQQTLLRSQLNENYHCELGEILFSREIEIGGGKKLEGRIRCRDQREIDFSQSSPNQRFQLRLCQPVVC
jgi:hypothetical protein